MRSFGRLQRRLLRVAKQGAWYGHIGVSVRCVSHKPHSHSAAVGTSTPADEFTFAPDTSAEASGSLRAASGQFSKPGSPLQGSSEQQLDDATAGMNFLGDVDEEMDEVAFSRTATEETDTITHPSDDAGSDLVTGQLPEYVLRRRESLAVAPTEILVEVATHYLRATDNVKLVSAEEEHALFPVLFERLQELHIPQLLDIVECYWARSTLVRYGTEFKDAVRDRIAEVANAAAARQKQSIAENVSPDFLDGGDLGSSGDRPDAFGGFGEDAQFNAKESLVDNGNDGDVGHIYAREEEEHVALARDDPILAAAASELDAQTVLRCIVVLGMSAGRRKRDLEFFSVMGAFFAANINQYKDPRDLVRVLTAMSRAKIIPSKSFLALLSRRFPVVCKRVPLEPLSCYRAMVNFARMGHENMSTYRFFADYMLAKMETNIAADIVEQKKIGTCVKEGVDTTSISDETKAIQRLKQLTDLTPTMLTRWLLVLARHDAPHQQYLRPLIKPVIVPMLPYFPPPSFTRLLLAVRMFQCGDADLLEPVIDFLCRRSDTQAVATRPTEFIDIMVVLSILSKEDTPVPRNAEQFFSFCRQECERGAIFTNELESDKGADTMASTTGGAALRSVLRPADMCTVANYLLKLQRKTDLPLEALEPLTALMEVFAARLTFLMSLNVVSLATIDILGDICAQQQHPDRSGNIAAMVEARRKIADSSGGAESDPLLGDGEDAYYSALDIDVRDTFFKILVVNSTNTYDDYRPLPGPMQVDFRDWLTKISAMDILEAVDLHERACPGALRAAPQRFLTRSILEKLGSSGEVVVDFEGHRLEVRQPSTLFLTRDDLLRLVELVQRTPLLTLRESPVVWAYIREKASRLNLTETTEQADAVLAQSL